MTSSNHQTPRQYIQLEHYRAAYQVMGQGKPLIFLHGFLGNGDNWHTLCAHLAEHHQCIALDLLGFGASDKPQLKYTIWHQIEFLQQFINALDLSAFHLVGHSYGGWLTAAYTIAATGIGWNLEKTAWENGTHPDAVPSVNAHPAANPPLRSPQSMTLIAPAGIRDDSFVGRYHYMRPLLWDTPIVDWVMAMIKPLAQLTGQANAFRTIDQARVELRAQPVAKSFIVDRLRPEDAIDTVECFLSHIQIPTLIIAAAQDKTIPLAHCETYRQQIPQSQFQLFNDAEHDLIQTHSHNIAAYLLPYLRDQTPNTAQPPNMTQNSNQPCRDR